LELEAEDDMEEMGMSAEFFGKETFKSMNVSFPKV